LAKLGCIVDIPLFGLIPVGVPQVVQEQDAEGCISVDIQSIGIKPTRNTFALRVSGDSMIGKHICDGDIVVMEFGPEPRNGQVVAVCIEGGGTLKTYLVKGGKPYLKAENPKYPDLIPAQELMIQGVFYRDNKIEARVEPFENRRGAEGNKCCQPLLNDWHNKPCKFSLTADA